jgi:acyl carrier protein
MNRFSLVKSLLKEFAGEQEIRPDSSLQALGLDSYDRLDFLLKVEEQFGIVLSNEEIMNMETVQDVLDCIAKNTEEEPC